MPVPQSSVQTMGGPGSDATMALAQELVDYIQGAAARDKGAEQATGVVKTDQENKSALVDEVAAKIKALIPAPKAPASADSSSTTASAPGAHPPKPPATPSPPPAAHPSSPPAH